MLIGSLALTAVASAQVDPYATIEQHATQNDIDSDVTPVAKKTDLWTLVHGAQFGDTGVRQGSITSFDSDLFAVSFRDTSLGLAGGSACETEPTREPGEAGAAFGTRVAECRPPGGEPTDRVPVLYRYLVPEDGTDPRWERLDLPGSKRSGFIGSIAWIDLERALIVGGTGEYPRRELGWSDEDQYGRHNEIADPTNPAKADVAGKARAWLYDAGMDSARELDLSELTPHEPARAGMRGLTAVDCFRDPYPGQRVVFPGSTTRLEPDSSPALELCFAGGLGQIWEWRHGAFTGKSVDSQSPDADLGSAELFRYRVREIEFSAVDPAQAVAVTAGCCAESSLDNAARSLVYTETIYQTGANPRRWAVQGGQTANADPTAPDSFYSVTTAPVVLGSNPHTSATVSRLSAPGGPESPGEPPSRMPGETAPALSTARLLSGDGDIWRQLKTGGVNTETRPESDSVPDWSVGELRSTALAGLGARGLLVTTGRKPILITLGLKSEVANLDPTPEEIAGLGYEPVDEGKFDTYRRSPYHLLPSYTANAIDVVGAEEDGWTVGDHGAILRLSANAAQAASAANEPEPPRVARQGHDRLAERGAYLQPPVPAAAGTVPPIGNETVTLDEPRMVPSGSVAGVGSSPGSIVDVVMSRDGSEGWAIGNDNGGAVFSYYDGSSWKRCDPLGIEGVVAPDLACEAIAPLRGYHDAKGNFKTVRLGMATRVPLENDSNPTNDGDLEIVAIGQNDPQGTYAGPETGGKELRAVVRYRDGRWRIVPHDPDHGLYAGISTNPSAGDIRDVPQQVTFASPTDGWGVSAKTGPTQGGNGHPVVHFDGHSWVNCSLKPLACGDPDRRLPSLGGAWAPTTDSPVRGFAVAGRRVYLYGARIDATSSTAVSAYRPKPMIIYRDPGGTWTDGGGPGEDHGGFDPAFSDPATLETGRVESLTVTQRADGGYEGWAAGFFSSGAAKNQPLQTVSVPPDAALMRLDPSSAGWRQFRSRGAFEDHMTRAFVVNLGRPLPQSNPRLAVSYPSDIAADPAFIGQEGSGGRIFGFDGARESFEQIQSGRPQGTSNVHLFGPPSPFGIADVMTADGHEGLWTAIRLTGTHVMHYTARPHKAVFEEASNPFEPRGPQLRGIAGGPDGGVWVATSSDRLFHYARGLGWEQLRVPGWEPGRVITRTSEATAIAVGADGEGLAVGEGGRIADLSPRQVTLNAAAGRSCALGDPIPCGTSRDLSAVDIASDGSALVAGDRLSILWRPAGGEFRSVSRPPLVSSTRIEGISYPSPERAYLATDAGALIRGDMDEPGVWRWQVENGIERMGKRTFNSIDRQGRPLAIRDVAVDAQGHGYAVGDQGLILERTEGEGWRRLPTRYAEKLTAVELPMGGGDGALVGGESGIILTRVGGEFELARPPDFPVGGAGPVVGFAYMPGSSEGSVDAWAGIGRVPAGEGDSRLLRYRSDPEDELLEPTAAVRPLADAPPSRDGELAIAAFGKSDCDRPESSLCPEMSATTTTNEVISQRIVDELAERRQSGGLDLAVLTGDAIDAAGRPASSLADRGAGNTQVAGPVKHRRYTEQVADRLEDEDIALFGAIGGQDLTENFACDTEGGCESTKGLANAGENLAWREAFAGRAEPWGDGEDISGFEGEIELSPAPGSGDNEIRVEDQNVPADSDGIAPDELAVGGASTHYAIDAERDGEAIARIVFVDTSLRSLAASDPIQQPHEIGGQLRFLERMICKRGDVSSTGDACTRERDQAAIVASNTPTYSYGPGALTHTSVDASIFETLMLRHDVDLVISGALGYNGVYYTLAPGIHSPCPGGEHPERPPAALPDCAGDSAGELSVLQEHGADLTTLLGEQGLTGALPTLIAAGAGGKFGPDGRQGPDGPAGQWHGYSIARLLPNGELVIEQRPILDWIGLDADEHALGARETLTLNGYGRSPISTTAEGMQVRAFHYEIENAAITHRYEVLLADLEKPWLPCEADDPDCASLHEKLLAGPRSLGSATTCEPYLCLPERIATVDDQSGQVRAGNGKYPDTFAVAMLSVGDHVATYPLFFKRSPSFVVRPAVGFPAIPNPPTDTGAAPAPPAPPSPPTPQIPQVNTPSPPLPPPIAPLQAAQPPEPQPPAPPAPLPPSEQPSPLNLALAPPSIAIATPTTVIQPPTPPVNPAPPGGARREARQRQAATQKSGADSANEGSQELGGDTAQAPPSANQGAFTRHEQGFSRGVRGRPEPSFTPMARPLPASGQDALYAGGMTLLAATLALGFTTMRPRPRRRTPEAPSPAWSAVRIRR